MKNTKHLFLLCMMIAAAAVTGCKISFDPNDVNAYIITYKTDKGETPKQIALAEGAVLKAKHLPQITTNYFTLDGWYIGDTKITAGYKITQDIELTAKWNFVAYEYTFTDTSDYTVSTSGSTIFTPDGEYTKVTYTKNTSSINNWVLNYNSKSIGKVHGFEFKAKCNDKMDFAGIQWFNTSGYDCYYFEVCGDGSFKIRSHIGSTWTTPYNKKDYVNKNDFNTINVKAKANSDYEIFVNGNHVFTIKKDELLITPGSIAYAVSPAKGTSSSSPANAWLKLLSFQQIK